MAPVSTAAATGRDAPRVFLSYSHDSSEHAARVLALALRLRRDGVDARIDQFEAFPPEGWPQWCARQILDSDYVVLICTETYRRRFLGYAEAGIGRGVKWEANVVQNILYNDEHNLRFIPAVFTKEDEQFVPETVQGVTRVLVGDSGAGDAGYATLLQRFTGGQTLAPLAEIPRIAKPLPLPDASVPTKQVWDEATAIVIQRLDEIRAEQEDHERKSAERHEELLAAVTHPVVLRARLEEKIDESFERKRGELLAAKASLTEIDSLYRLRDRAKGQIAEAVAFITARAGDVNSPIIRHAAALLEERGVDATLEFLDATLKAERQRRQEEGRQFAEASMMKADLHESRFETAEQERAIRDAIADAPDWWRPHNVLGLLLKRRAEWQPAEQEYEAARKTMGTEGEAVVLNNLATLYQDTNRLAEAEPLMERALKIDEQSFGPEHPAVAGDLDNLAQLYQATNRLAEAEPLIERALKIGEKSFGPEHPNVAIRLHNLAGLYQATNRLAEAEPLMKRVASIFEKSYGPEHPNVAVILNNLAGLYQDTNRLAEAEPLIERALKIDEKSFGSEHPNVAIRLNNLAQLYRATNRLVEAEPLMERALKIVEKSFGPEHPKVAIRLNNLAQLYRATNRLAEAEPLMRRHLVIFLKFTRTTGHPHPHLNDAVDNYIGLLGAMSLPETEIAQRLAAAGHEAGYTPEAFAELLKQLAP